MIRDFIKTIVKNLFKFLGLEVTSVGPEREPPQVFNDLEKVLGLNRIGLQASYECSLDQCLILSGFSFSKTGWHPFVEAYHDISQDLDRSGFKGSFLEKYYKIWTPACSSEAIAGFNNAPEMLKSIEPFTLHAPWMEANPQDRQAMIAIIIANENKAAGFPEVTAKDGYGLHGPVSEKKGEIEFRRLLNVYKSIKAKGYDRTQGDGDVTAIAIEYNGEFRFCIMHGQHRVAAVAALEFRTVPVKITNVIQYEEIEHWPQVHRNYWSVSQAQNYVEHLFSFDSKSWARSKGLIG